MARESSRTSVPDDEEADEVASKTNTIKGKPKLKIIRTPEGPAATNSGVELPKRKDDEDQTEKKPERGILYYMLVSSFGPACCQCKKKELERNLVKAYHSFRLVSNHAFSFTLSQFDLAVSKHYQTEIYRTTFFGLKTYLTESFVSCFILNVNFYAFPANVNWTSWVRI